MERPLGVILDADAGAMRLTGGDEPGGQPGVTWHTAFPSGLRPGPAVGGALFPCITGSHEAVVQVNAGADPARPFKFGPQGADLRQVRETSAGHEVRTVLAV